jgi:hypothetical protein
MRTRRDDQRSTMQLTIKVKPNARRSELIQQPDGGWAASLASPPVDGKANAELIALVARHFGVAKSRVTLVHGATSRIKRVQVAD